MSRILIESMPKHKKQARETEDFLDVSELFYDTVQGEGVSTGVPAVFLRVQNCSLNCTYCDTSAVWRHGNPYTFKELLKMMWNEGVVDRLLKGHHLVLTGGSPLKQQDKLIKFLWQFIDNFNFKPYIEVENECTILPKKQFSLLVDQWNNCPKLRHSGNTYHMYYRPDILVKMKDLPNSWFKFVVRDERDWTEIHSEYLQKGLIRSDQVILMPLGGSLKELEKHREMVVKLAVRNNVRYCTREHVVLWDKMTGV